ncbi:MAG: acyltransferase family protein [Sphingobacteriales bacterium]|nr:MAG: acyltransferase family protein [Sphingobacteriales bacterium]
MSWLSSIKEKIDSNKNSNKDFLSKFPNKVGTYGYDAWGFNLKGIKPFVEAGRFIYENYFRVETYGLENIPKDGSVLIIGNHSGQLPIDAVLLGYSLITNKYAPRVPKGMYERFVPQVPFIGMLFSQWGGTLGDPENCDKMLSNGEAVIVFPEGARGISKPTSKKYQLQKFGNGYIHMAVKNKTPIIPVGIVGCEEILINFGNIDLFQKLFKFPAFPSLLPVVFPSKVIMHFGKPIYFDGDIGKEHIMEDMNQQVKNEIKKLIDQGLQKRKGVFS